MKSKRQAIVDALEMLGYVKMECKSKKYVRYVKGNRSYLVGKSAGLRYLDATTGNVSESRSVTGGPYYRALVTFGHQSRILTDPDQIQRVFQLVYLGHKQPPQ